MNLNELADRISELEGKKVQINIAQTKEILKIICGIMIWHPDVIVHMIENGLKQKKAWSIRRKKVKK